MLLHGVCIFIVALIISLYRKINIGILLLSGLFIYSIILRNPVSEPPLDLVLIILSCLIGSNTLAVVGGYNIIANKFEKMIIKHPRYTIVIATFASYFLVIFSGTSYSALVIMPVIASIAQKVGSSPPRALVCCTIAANSGSLCSPISAPMSALKNALEPFNISLTTITLVMFISTFSGISAMCFYNTIADKKEKKEKNVTNNSVVTNEIKNNVKMSILLFACGILIIFISGIFSQIRSVGDNEVKTSWIMAMIMFSTSVLILLLNKNIKMTDVFKQESFVAGVNAIVIILGVTWFANTIVSNNRNFIFDVTHQLLTSHEYVFGLTLFLASVFMSSHTAAISTIHPIAVLSGMDPLTILSFTPMGDGIYVIAISGIFSYAMSCDNTGTLRLGKFFINNSFVTSGLITTTVSTLVAQLVVCILRMVC